MDGFSFIASLVGSLVWPAVVVVGALIFRPQVGALVGRISRAKAGPVEVWAPVQAVGEALQREAERISGHDESLIVTPASAVILETIGAALQRLPPSMPDQYAELVGATTVGSAGSLARGQAGQGVGNITIAMKGSLPAGRTSIRVVIDTPGVGFDETPILTTNTASGVQATVRRDAENTLAIELVGPTDSPVQVTLSAFRLSVAADAPLGAVRMSVSISGSPSHAIASIGTVVQPTA